MIWNNNQGVATWASNNTHKSKPKATKRKKTTYKLQRNYKPYKTKKKKD